MAEKTSVRPADAAPAKNARARRKATEQTAAASRPKRSSLAASHSDEPVNKRRKVTPSKDTETVAETAPLTKDKKTRAATPSKSSTKDTSRSTETAQGIHTLPQASDSRNYWLMKAEPESRLEQTANGTKVDVKFSIDDLRSKTSPEPWEGIRNPSAQKCLRAMSLGDLAFFYESNVKIPGIVGVMEIVHTARPDETAFDRGNPYYDAKSDPDNPRWQLVDVEFRIKFAEKIPLKTLQGHAKDGGPLGDLQAFRQARLSVSQVMPEEWKFIASLLGEGDRAELDAVERRAVD